LKTCPYVRVRKPKVICEQVSKPALDATGRIDLLAKYGELLGVGLLHLDGHGLNLSHLLGQD